MIKICINPQCAEVAHNCDKETKCRNCDFRLIAINEETYREKFINNFFQYDYNEDHKLVTPCEMGYSKQLQLF